MNGRAVAEKRQLYNNLDYVLIWPHLGICTACAVVKDVPVLLLNQPNIESRNNHHDVKHFAVRLALKKRLKVTRKWSIEIKDFLLFPHNDFLLSSVWSSHKFRSCDDFIFSRIQQWIALILQPASWRIACILCVKSYSINHTPLHPG